jgi:hypothetical protein
MDMYAHEGTGREHLAKELELLLSVIELNRKTLDLQVEQAQMLMAAIEADEYAEHMSVFGYTEDNNPEGMWN